MNQSTGQSRQDIDLDKNPKFVSYADMSKRPKEIQSEAHSLKNSEKFVKLTKNLTNKFKFKPVRIYFLF